MEGFAPELALVTKGERCVWIMSGAGGGHEYDGRGLQGDVINESYPADP